VPIAHGWIILKARREAALLAACGVMRAVPARAPGACAFLILRILILIFLRNSAGLSCCCERSVAQLLTLLRLHCRNCAGLRLRNSRRCVARSSRSC